jgi:DNA polymerase III sliding clamp (beta) subunit (PCNA family)
MPQVTVSAERAFEAAGIMQDLALESKTPTADPMIHLRAVAGTLRMTVVHDRGEAEIRWTTVCEIPAECDQILDVRVAADFAKMLKKVASKVKKASLVIDVEFLPGESKPATINLIAGAAKKTFTRSAFGDSTEPRFELAKGKPLPVDPKDFGKLIKTVRPFVSKDLLAYRTARMAFETEDGELLAIGTDGHRMIRGSLRVPTRGFTLQGGGNATLSAGQAEGLERACRLADRVELRVEKVGQAGSIFSCSARTPEGLIASFGMVAAYASFPPWRQLTRSEDDSRVDVRAALTAAGVQTLRSLCVIERALNTSVEQPKPERVGDSAPPPRIGLGVVSRADKTQLGACTDSGSGGKQACGLVATSSLHASKHLRVMFDAKYVDEALSSFKGGVDLYLYDDNYPAIMRGTNGPVGIESYVMPMRWPQDQAASFKVGARPMTVGSPIDVETLDDAAKLAKLTFHHSFRLLQHVLVESDGSRLEFLSTDVGTTASTRIPWKGPRFQTLVPTKALAGVISAFPKRTLLDVSVDPTGVFEIHDQSTGITVPLPSDVPAGEVGNLPPVPVPPCDQPILTSEAGPFATCMRAILPSVSDGAARPQLESLQIECSDGSMLMAGTDGGRLSRATAPAAQSQTGAWVVPVAAAKVLEQTLSDRSRTVEMSHSEPPQHQRPWIQFAVAQNGGVEQNVWTVQSSYDFPQYKQILRKSASCGITDAMPKDMLAALKKTTAFGSVKGDDMYVALSKGPGGALTIQSVSYKAKASVPASIDGLPPAGRFWGPHLAQAIEPMQHVTTDVRLYLGPDNEPCVIQGLISPTSAMETLLMPGKPKSGESDPYAKDAPSTVKIPDLEVSAPKLRSKRASGKRPSPRKPSAKRSSPTKAQTTAKGQELIDALNDFMANKTNFDWQPDGADRIVLNWEREPLGVVTYEGNKWVIRHKAPGGATLAYPVKTLDELTDWIRDEIGQRSRAAAAKKRSARRAAAKKPSPKRTSHRHPTRESLGLGKAPWSKRALYVLDNYSLRQMDDGRWEALRMRPDGTVFARYEADTRAEAIRMAHAQWGHMNFEDESEAFNVVFPWQFQYDVATGKVIDRWAESSPKRPSPKFSVGDKVAIKGTAIEGRIVRGPFTQPGEHEFMYEVENAWTRETAYERVLVLVPTPKKSTDVDPALWTTRRQFGAAGGADVLVLTDKGRERAFSIGAQVTPEKGRALQELSARGGKVLTTRRRGGRLHLTPFGEEHSGLTLMALAADGLIRRLYFDPHDPSFEGEGYEITDLGRERVARGHAEERELLARVERQEAASAKKPSAKRPSPKKPSPKRPSPKKASKPRHVFPIGAKVLVDGQDEAIVRQAFPEGSHSLLGPHYVVRIVDGGEIQKVPMSRVGVERKRAPKPASKKPSRKAPSRKPSAKKAPSKRRSTKRLYITDDGAFEKLAAIEGKLWERKQLDRGVKLDNGFFLNLEAFKVIVEQGLAGLDIPLSDLDEKAGAIAGFAGAGYIVMPDGQIMLDGATASAGKRQKAAKVMQVIEDE